MRPRSISGAAGSRIKLFFGETGSDYLYFFDEDDGSSEWQTNGWTVGPGGLPNGLAKQLNNMSSKGRHVKEVSFGPSDEWYVNGEKRDGTGRHSWWGGCSDSVSDVIKEWTNSSWRLRVCFGPHSTDLILKGNNGYSCSFLDDDLESRIKMINRKNGTIHFVRLFPEGGYYIRDTEGSEWKGLGSHLKAEFDKGGVIHDVVVAGDGSWVVIRSNHYVSSNGVSIKVTQLLTEFYERHKERQNIQSQKIQKYNARMKREREEREAVRLREEKKKQLEQARIKKEAEEREAAARLKKQLEEAAKRKRQTNERHQLLQNKRIKTGDRVTALNISKSPGDFVVDSISPQGELELYNTVGYYYHSCKIEDPSRLIRYDDDEEDVEKINLLCFAADEYEAAISLFHCKCFSDGTCLCKRVFNARASLRSSDATLKIGDRVDVIGFAKATVIPNELQKTDYVHRVHVRYDDGKTYYCKRDQLRKFVGSSPIIIQVDQPVRPLLEHRGEVLNTFDEYRCAEKIDFEALKRIRLDLQKDSRTRKEWYDGQKQRLSINESAEKNIKKLQKCQVLEMLVECLYDMLKDLPTDDTGCVVHEVEYEQRDPSFRGRIFAKGKLVKSEDDAYPRSATLQGMHKDLRAALVGKFAHDIDCENSEVRLICSLASQHDMTSLIPTIIDYRDNRNRWLVLIQQCHSVSESEAKRLPNIILSGGRYETWARALKLSIDKNPTRPDAKKVKKFVFGLYAECHAIRDKLLEHPRFRWTSVDRKKLVADGKTENKAKSELLPTIVRSCENEVLGIIHRHFVAQKWRIRAKVFDGLIAEPGPEATMRLLNDVMRSTEKACAYSGWDVRLIEKPLHGLHDQPIETIHEGRRALEQLQAKRVPYASYCF